MTRFTEAKYQALFERLHYEFKDRALLKLSLTHASTSKTSRDYERLEFLGDRVLGLIVAEELYIRRPTLQEGQLAPRFSALVKGETCAEIARSLGLAEFIRVGQKEAVNGVNLNMTVLGDVMEAVIGAIYLDAGIEAARRFVLRHWEPYLASRKAIKKDSKTFLQEWALGKGLAIPRYVVMGREGPDHAPRFVIRVEIDGKDSAQGEGLSKRVAEHAAATAFIERERLRK